MISTIAVEDLIFLTLATAFLAVTGWAWRSTKPYELPQPLPHWFRYWFLTVQIGGLGLPLVVLGWAVWQGQAIVSIVLLSYLGLLGCQILSESLCLRQFRSTAFIMVPYLYIPYRFWQLYEGLNLVPTRDLDWVRWFLLFEMALWIGNYCLDLAQLPRLLHWDRSAN
ncbi:MAG: hypothetical protein KME17_31285 [Cyanosarcina radialis HA8281-LM2]|jgi:hypothetical protein|nr:hypothetical protein [Cyanosarcina radialis HA8281-LM2]